MKDHHYLLPSSGQTTRTVQKQGISSCLSNIIIIFYPPPATPTPTTFNITLTPKHQPAATSPSPKHQPAATHTPQPQHPPPAISPSPAPPPPSETPEPELVGEEEGRAEHDRNTDFHIKHINPESNPSTPILNRNPTLNPPEQTNPPPPSTETPPHGCAALPPPCPS
ncbi:extensin-like [Lotus japonicus]|uniref:extensin-like n=1 Tax=Lotus japonicus TaxID=34305 RepID=UPI002582A520|nr:extensin-like [Lotus japonicus]